MVTHVHRFALQTSDGLSLRAEHNNVEDAVAAAVLCHPHPLHGGTMYASVIDHLFGALTDRSVLCCRFNFRGGDGSDGRHDYGQGERLDVVAALDYLAAAAPDTPLWLIGWSFGADVSLAVAHDRVAGWVAVAPPLRVIDPADMVAATDARPTVLAVPQHDQFNPPEQATAGTADWQNTRVVPIAMADHFLHGALGTVTDIVHHAILGPSTST